MFMLKATDIPQIKNKLHMWTFVNNFDDEYDGIKDPVNWLKMVSKS